MKSEFFRFPHTPHLIWLGNQAPRGDKVLSAEDVRILLEGEIAVEEKIDGTNVGLSVDECGTLRVQSRGEFLGPGGARQFDPLWPWLDERKAALTNALGQGLVLFGEWCFAVHSVRYDRLPDWFLAFDVYDREAGRFWSVDRRNHLLVELGLAPVPALSRGRFLLSELLGFLGGSRVSSSPMEGVYLRRDVADWLLGRAKIVRPEFAESIDEHWSKRPFERNGLLAETTDRVARHGANDRPP